MVKLNFDINIVFKVISIYKSKNSIFEEQFPLYTAIFSFFKEKKEKDFRCNRG